MTLSQKLTAVAENMTAVYEAGKDQIFHYVTQPSGMFYKRAFPEGSSLSVRLPDSNGVLTDMFRLVTGLDTLTLTLPPEQSCKLNYFAYSSSLRLLQLPAGIKASSFIDFANRCSALEEISGVIDLSESTSNEGCFSSCPLLREVRFRPESIFLSISFKQSKVLSAQTVQSIVEGLATVQQTQTLTLHENVKAALTQEQRAVITARNWLLG